MPWSLLAIIASEATGAAGADRRDLARLAKQTGVELTLT
jgi:hypothetical protein